MESAQLANNLVLITLTALALGSLAASTGLYLEDQGEQKRHQEAAVTNEAALMLHDQAKTELIVANIQAENTLEYCEAGFGSLEQCDLLESSLIEPAPVLRIVSADSFTVEDLESNSKTLRERAGLMRAHSHCVVDKNRDTFDSVNQDVATELEIQLQTAEKAILNADQAFSDSDGQVLDESLRTALTKKRNQVQQLAQSIVEDLDKKIKLIADLEVNCKDLASSTERVTKAIVVQRRQTSVQAEVEPVQQTDTDWEPTNERTSPVPTPRTNTYYLSASSCADPKNAQGCVDGFSVTAIDFTPFGGPFWIGGHNSGAAGIILNFQPGDIVVVSGAGAGTYQITGSMWIPMVAGTPANAYGGGFAFQTCGGDQMRLVFASRI